jgi:hypothetical protein
MIDLTHSSSPNFVRRQCPCRTINATSVYYGSKIGDGAYMGFGTPQYPYPSFFQEPA